MRYLTIVDGRIWTLDHTPEEGELRLLENISSGICIRRLSRARPTAANEHSLVVHDGLIVPLAHEEDLTMLREDCVVILRAGLGRFTWNIPGYWSEDTKDAYTYPDYAAAQKVIDVSDYIKAVCFPVLLKNVLGIPTEFSEVADEEVPEGCYFITQGNDDNRTFLHPEFNFAGGPRWTRQRKEALRFVAERFAYQYTVLHKIPAAVIVSADDLPVEKPPLVDIIELLREAEEGLVESQNNWGMAFDSLTGNVVGLSIYERTHEAVAGHAIAIRKLAQVIARLQNLDLT